MLGDTASITVVTGLPGSGKSLRFAEEISKAVAAGEHVYVCNIDGLKIKGVTPFEDARRWRELPPGSVLFVDEAQAFFGERRGGEPPEYVRMNKIRHDGIRMVLATQQPNYLDTYLRGLVGRHEHMLRRHGKQESFMFSDNQVMDNVRGKLAVIKRTYDYKNYKFNPKYFAMYDSAQTHSIKYQMPALVRKALMVLPVVIVFGVVAFFTVYRDTSLAKSGEDAPSKASLSATPGGVFPAQPQGKVLTVVSGEQYVAQLAPMVQDVPWSAPAFVNRAVVADPHIYCMATENSCRCVTEQNTRVLPQIRDDICRDIARWGEPYNPFKSPAGPQPVQQVEREEPKPQGVGEQAPGIPLPVAVAVGKGINAAQTFPESPGFPISQR